MKKAPEDQINVKSRIYIYKFQKFILKVLLLLFLYFTCKFMFSMVEKSPTIIEYINLGLGYIKIIGTGKDGITNLSLLLAAIIHFPIEKYLVDILYDSLPISDKEILKKES